MLCDDVPLSGLGAGLGFLLQQISVQFSGTQCSLAHRNEKAGKLGLANVSDGSVTVSKMCGGAWF